MADYQKAFEYAFSLESTDLSKSQIKLNGLPLWKTLQRNGFSQGELYALFKGLYGAELWRLLRGAKICNQKTAGLLLLVASKGFLPDLIHELQHFMGIEQNNEMCGKTIKHLNNMPANKVHQWLSASLAYYELVQHRREIVDGKTSVLGTLKGEIIPNIGILTV
ncbi:hypothetical protein [Pseudoalteromonas luteoviolacea]|uniref:hypothetical protein n=1 Tax=Pseudoalteromonas luteoviolacea TaxID=43657 RepID=UPI0011545157|nr:hypothetical protein [Pseudoalteromonas luteoviolacea]TQF70944.1 hypothetical protein FLM44_07610 [Pseudoalteromonas luteoviolacea]